MKFKSFIAESTRLARELVNESDPNDIQYLNRLRVLLGQVEDIPKFNSENAIIKKGGKGWNWCTVADSMPLYGIQLNIASGGSLPTHDHRGYIGLGYVLDGQVKVTTYSKASVVDGELLLTKISESILSPGEFGIVPLKSANIHTIQDIAGGSTLLDLLTIFNGDGDSYEIKINDKKNYEGLYPASFTGNKI
ncbi:hypothetical protein A9Q99_15420 [Gammaproteobacteria bacterium 45_16_T64]|nr:hypothetical protein A9Q99_15420 [Gammaproteobacteria bacterium 45_16_T64]